MKHIPLISILIFLFGHSNAQSQKIKTFDGGSFSINYPADWSTTNDNGILNFFPKDDFGAVTISVYSDIDFPLEMTREFILEMNGVTDSPDKVKMTKVNDVTEYYYEHVDQTDKIQWVTRALRKKNDFYLVTVNCELPKWNDSKKMFLEVLKSFGIK